jgi:hypothetical protein
MATIKWDTLEGSAASRGLLNSTRDVGGIVLGVDTSNPAAALENALTAITAVHALGSTHAHQTTLTLQTIQMRGVSGDAVRFVCQYASAFSTPFNAYYIEEDSYLSEEETMRIPGTATFPKLSFTAASTANSLMEDNLRFRMMMPHRGIRLYGIKSSAPDAAFKNAVGYVNSDTWQDLAAAHWLILKHRVTRAKTEGSYSYETVIAGKVSDDWRVLQMMMNRHTGRVPKGIVQGDIDAVRNATYSPRATLYSGADATKGVCAVCPYPWTSFATLFGTIS